MPPVNVDNLMRELNIEQLIQVQLKLKNEIENKREDLRQMVGRRYRDVLEASNTVKRLTEISSELVILLNKIKLNFCSPQNVENNLELIIATKSGNNCRNLLLLYTLLPIISSTSNILTRSFALCISENLQKKLLIEQQQQLLNKNNILTLLFNYLFKLRIELENELFELLNIEKELNSIITILICKILLNPKLKIFDLILIFLNSKKKIILELINLPNFTLLGLINNIKDTIEFVEQIFGKGKGLIYAIKIVIKNNWAPGFLFFFFLNFLEEIKQLLEDQTLFTSKILEKEICLINSSVVIDEENKFKLEEEKGGEIKQKCFEWINNICLITKDRVEAMCNHFERVEQIVEFSVAIGNIFKTDYLINSEEIKEEKEEEEGYYLINIIYSFIYKQLFGELLLKRFNQLIDFELNLLEKELHNKLFLINCKPKMIFNQRIGTVKFDNQLALGISLELNELIQEFNNNLFKLQKNVLKYINFGKEDHVSNLNNILAEKVYLMVERLTNLSNWGINLIKPLFEQEQLLLLFNSSFSLIEKEQQLKWLSLFYLFLALIQHEPLILCQCMNHNLERIVNCNKLLNTATEQSLCQFINCIINKHFYSSNLFNNLLNNVKNWYEWMELLQEPENVLLNEKIKLLIPTQISNHFYIFLIEICSELNQNSLGHLFTKNVTLHISKQISYLFIEILKQCSINCLSIQPICVQLIFDCKTFFQMFPDKQFLEIAKLIENKMDPIEINLIKEPLLRNAKLFAQRTSMLFGQLQSEPITAFNKEVQLEESYSSLIDIIPRVNNIQRLAQIPRLSKFRDINQLKEEEEKNKEKRISKSPQRLLGEGGSKGQSSSFSSFYDKISTSLFNK